MIFAFFFTAVILQGEELKYHCFPSDPLLCILTAKKKNVCTHV